MSIRIITDSGADIPQRLGASTGENPRDDLTILPMHVYFGEKEFLDGVNLSHQQFYEMLIESEELPKTSQIPPYEFEQVYEQAVAAGEQVVVITISSKLSGTYQSACVAAEDYEGKVYVVDSLNATLGERCLVDYALRLKDQGKTAEEIVAELTQARKRIRLLALLDTLEYLKRGGRISKSVAMVGGMLSIKPVVSVVDGEVVMVGKAVPATAIICWCRRFRRPEEWITLCPIIWAIRAWTIICCENTWKTVVRCGKVMWIIWTPHPWEAPLGPISAPEPSGYSFLRRKNNPAYRRPQLGYWANM